MGQINNSVFLRGCISRLQKQKGNRLKQVYLKSHIKPVTTDNHHNDVEAENALS